MRYLLAVLAIVALAVPAQAQQGCGPAAGLLEILTGPKYREAPFLTLGGERGPFRLFVNLATQTWTLVGFPAAQPNVACIIAGGKGIERSALPMQFMGDPT